MEKNRKQKIESLIHSLPRLTAGQLHWVQRVVSIYKAEHEFTLHESDLFDANTLQNFGDAMRVHHSFSSEPFSKDKFEYVLVNVLKLGGHEAKLAPKGNPGHDATIKGVKVSLKTQADKKINNSTIWISKFMELGKGNWSDNPIHLEGLRDQFLRHMNFYERIFSLRAIRKAPNWKYELIEIPTKILKLAVDGELEMKLNSKQSPKPGYCYVRNEKKETIFDLYFDGGGERKLQIKKLNKSYCKVHAVWEFFIPPE